MSYTSLAIEFLFATFVLICPCFSSLTAQQLEQTTPPLLGIQSEKLDQLRPIIEQGIQEKKMPGCVVCMGRHGKIFYLESFGSKQVVPDAVPMTNDTLFDMASITKPVATATSIMMLVERGKLKLDDTVAFHFPDFANNGKEIITIEDLLLHQSGLIPDNPMADYLNGPEMAWSKICQLKLVVPVRTEFKYSDVNFIILGQVVKKISGQDLHEFTQENIFKKLSMNDTGFVPKSWMNDEEVNRRAAPTEKRGDAWIRGEVHDPRAYQLGGIAGHAGLFSTASDLAIYADSLLQEFRTDTKLRPSILQKETIELMTKNYKVSSGIRGLGWDKRTGYSSNRGEKFSDAAFGHGGFTGTVLWIDPELDLFFIFLSNRVHPDGKGSVNQLAGRLASILAECVLPE